MSRVFLRGFPLALLLLGGCTLEGIKCRVMSPVYNYSPSVATAETLYDACIEFVHTPWGTKALVARNGTIPHPMHLLVNKKTEENLAELINKKPRLPLINPVSLAIQDSRIKIVRAYAENLDFYDPHRTSDWSNNTLLHSAVKVDSLEMVGALLDGGATVNVLDRWGHTPLLYAVEGENIAMIRLLLNAGADPDLGSMSSIRRNKYKPMGLAVMIKNPTMVRMLLAAGADVSLDVTYRKIGGGIYKPLQWAKKINWGKQRKERAEVLEMLSQAEESLAAVEAQSDSQPISKAD